MKPITLDDIDEKILAAFQADGRLSNRAVGRGLGVSESGVRKRMKRMTDAGAISYGLVLDQWATGLEVSGWLWIEVQPSQARKVAGDVGASDHCSVSFVTTGSWNVVAYIFAFDLEGLRETVAGVERLKGVRRAAFRLSLPAPTLHRHELIMFSSRATQPRWPIET